MVEGDVLVKVNWFVKIEEGGVGVISFLVNFKYEFYIYDIIVLIVVVSCDF